ncbi:hypothetical protein M0R45_012854 [Rubus argutus]|uniref:Uncharacterized protein n=1 Tax=Rubus argutus TaxID=59490 RepID=A0AAW1XJQ0_RUBAR
MDYETLIENIDKDVEDLEQLRTTTTTRRIPSLTRKFRFKNQMRLIKTIGKVEERLEALDPYEYSIFDLDSARQQLGYARQEANRKLTEMDLSFVGKSRRLVFIQIECHTFLVNNK